MLGPLVLLTANSCNKVGVHELLFTIRYSLQPDWSARVTITRTLLTPLQSKLHFKTVNTKRNKTIQQYKNMKQKQNPQNLERGECIDQTSVIVITVIVIIELLTVRQKLVVPLLRKSTQTSRVSLSQGRLDLLDLLSECAIMNK